MPLHKERRIIIFRKEEFEVVYHYYLCPDTQEDFTSDDLDEINLLQVHNQYRERHKFPYPEQIRAIREKYGLPAIKMSEVLGFGVNMYRNYENGEVPSESNARLIQLAKDPMKFKSLVEFSGVYQGEEYINIQERLNLLIEKDLQENWVFWEEDYLLDFDKSIGIMTGFTKPNLDKLRQMIIFLTAETRPWKTKMNKLLFYADFLNFKKTCYSISGAQYRAIDMGPVPNKFSSIFEFCADREDIAIQRISFPNGALGEQFLPNPKCGFKRELFNEDELESLEQVAKKFKRTTVSAIIDISHQESAWYENFEQGKQMISYEYGFDLTSI
jgi:transcriptional regulator with XRE-family HTH domain/uncharacterized phage-associated protein